MNLLERFRHWRLRRRFVRVGSGCRFTGIHYEIKGHFELGSDCELGGNLVLRTHKAGRVVIGDRVKISDYVIFNINSPCFIGEGTYIGPYSVIRDSVHWFHGTDVHWRLTPLETEPIRIGRDCYIDAGCYIMPGVTIGDGAVVAPRSIVNKDIGPNEVWAGAPVSRVAHRTNETQTTTLRRQLELVSMYGFGRDLPGKPEDD